MRTPNKLVSLMLTEMPYIVNAQLVPYFIELASLSQKDGYNQGVKDAAENAKTKDIVDRVAPMSIHQIIDKDSILKLLKP